MRIRNLAAGVGRKLGRALKRTQVGAGAAILAGGMMFAGSANAQLLSEDFEGLTLQDTVNSGGNGLDTEEPGTAVWTDVAPAGWTRDNTTTPSGGPIEFFGWTFVDKDWWDTTAGQGRGGFTRGSGTVAVADGDEYDDGAWDGIEGDPGSMNVFFTTPAIDLTSVDPTRVQVAFDSSFRPYPTQQGLVDVSFDGGTTWNNLLTLNDSTVPGGTSSFDRANEAVVLDPGASGSDTSMQVRFGYVDGGNDWWWAIDNVTVGTPEQLALSIEVADNGEVLIANRTSETVNLDYYEIESAGGSLVADVQGFEDQGSAPGFPGGDGTGNGWEEGGTEPDDGEYYNELYLQGYSSLAPGETRSLGIAYDTLVDAEDLVFRYGEVFLTQGGSPDGDYDGDGDVDDDDYTAWRSAFGTADAAADGNGNGVVDAADYTIWRDNFGSTGNEIVQDGPSVLTDGVVLYLPPPGALGNGANGVPEPSSIALVGAFVASAAGVVRMRRS